jgi:hypothetical protein
MQKERILDHAWIFCALAQSESRMAYRASYGSEEIGQESIVIMEKLSKTISFAHVIRMGDCSAFEVLGAKVKFWLDPQADDEAPRIIRETMPPGVFSTHPTVTRPSKFSLFFRAILKYNLHKKWISDE